MGLRAVGGRREDARTAEAGHGLAFIPRAPGLVPRARDWQTLWTRCFLGLRTLGPPKHTGGGVGWVLGEDREEGGRASTGQRPELASAG